MLIFFASGVRTDMPFVRYWEEVESERPLSVLVDEIMDVESGINLKGMKKIGL